MVFRSRGVEHALAWCDEFDVLFPFFCLHAALSCRCLHGVIGPAERQYMPFHVYFEVLDWFLLLSSRSAPFACHSASAPLLAPRSRGS